MEKLIEDALQLERELKEEILKKEKIQGKLLDTLIEKLEENN